MWGSSFYLPKPLYAKSKKLQGLFFGSASPVPSVVVPLSRGDAGRQEGEHRIEEDLARNVRRIEEVFVRPLLRIDLDPDFRADGSTVRAALHRHREGDRAKTPGSEDREQCRENLHAYGLALGGARARSIMEEENVAFGQVPG